MESLKTDTRKMTLTVPMWSAVEALCRKKGLSRHSALIEHLVLAELERVDIPAVVLPVEGEING